MNSISKILLIAGAGIAFLYYRTYNSVKSIIFEFRKISIKNISKSGVKLNFWIKVKSSAKKEVILNDVNLDLYLNNEKVGKCDLPYPQIIEKNANHDLLLEADINYEVFSQISKMFANMQTSKIDVYIAGSIYVDSLLVPVPKINVFTEDFKEAFTNVISKL